MPDHLHLLAQGTRPPADLREFIRVLKLLTAFEFRQRNAQRLWEKSYYDHMLRSSDSDVAHYIWWNPVRKHLCHSPREFCFSGSQSIPWNTQAVSAPTWIPPCRNQSLSPV